MTRLVQIIDDEIWYDGFRVAKLEPISPSLPFSSRHQFMTDLIFSLDAKFNNSKEFENDED